jgi:hypothetical protein
MAARQGNHTGEERLPVKPIAQVAFVYVMACMAAESATLVLAPVNGALAGPSGSTVGWGFTIANTTPGAWIEITSARFCSGTSGTNTACGAIPLGIFTDIVSGFNDIAAGPSPDSTSVTQSFIAGAAGIGGFLITASSGQAAGQIVLTYNLFSRSPHDPNFNPDTDTVSTDNFLAAPASVTVTNPVNPTIPTMSTWGLVFLAMLLMGFAARKLEVTALR